MDTPIWDFLQKYRQAGTRRFHMPGHKGAGPLGCEAWDITEISGADSLYEASGVIARSEGNAAALFGAGATFYSTGGSSQCVKAMLHLALQNRPADTPPVILAARNVHKSFVHAAALLDFTPVWLWPEGGLSSLCACPLTVEGLDRALGTMDAPPAAVYVTSPDYLGNTADISALGRVCRRWGVPLLVDGAHGAYLRFLEPSRHPLDLGADLCCDSAHKTLPVLTGGAYLHVSQNAPAAFRAGARAALALFGSTSPPYLVLASLDRCNADLAGGYSLRLAERVRELEILRAGLGSPAADSGRRSLRPYGHGPGGAAAEGRRGVRVRRQGLHGADGHAGEHPGGSGPGAGGPGGEPPASAGGGGSAPGQGGAGDVPSAGPAGPPGDRSGGGEPGADLRRSHSELSPGHPHRRLRRAHRISGPGAVPVLRRGAGGRGEGARGSA